MRKAKAKIDGQISAYEDKMLARITELEAKISAAEGK